MKVARCAVAETERSTTNPIGPRLASNPSGPPPETSRSRVAQTSRSRVAQTSLTRTRGAPVRRTADLPRTTRTLTKARRTCTCTAGPNRCRPRLPAACRAGFRVPSARRRGASLAESRTRVASLGPGLVANASLTRCTTQGWCSRPTRLLSGTGLPRTPPARLCGTASITRSIGTRGTGIARGGPSRTARSILLGRTRAAENEVQSQQCGEQRGC